MQVENTVFRRNESHDIYLPNPHRGKEAACVFLVVDDHVDTDSTPIMHVPRAQDFPKTSNHNDERCSLDGISSSSWFGRDRCIISYGRIEAVFHRC